MELELEARPPEDSGWRRSLVLLALLIALVVAAQLAGARIRQKGEPAGSAYREQALTSGDFYAKLNLARPSRSWLRSATRSYRKALPWPSAYRRLGVLSESSGKSGLHYFLNLDSREGTKGLGRKDIAKLHREKAMWLHILSGKKLSPDEARLYAHRIESLNLGPLKSSAVAMVCKHSGQTAKYRQVIADARASATFTFGLWFALLGVLIVGGIVGLFAAVLFLAEAAPRFADAPRLPLQSSMLMSSFIVYLASYIGLSGLTELAADALGLSSVSKWSGIAYICLVIFAAAAAFCLGMLTLVGRAKLLGQDWREIGFRTTNAARSALIGIKGYFASLSFVLVAAIIAAVLARTIFRRFQTPEQPLDQIITEGGVLEVVLVFIAASIVAPIVEETFFRGVLYSAFRTRLNVWPSVLLTSAIFAVIHPLPGGFLPIFTLACVLAVLRERTGSLLPGMVCHCVYNSVLLLFVALVR